MSRDEQRPRVTDSAKYLNEHLHEVPVMLIPCLEGRPDGAPAALSASFWGSLLPAVWSFMLALRSRGLGLGVDDAAPARRRREAGR